MFVTVNAFSKNDIGVKENLVSFFVLRVMSHKRLVILIGNDKLLQYL